MLTIKCHSTDIPRDADDRTNNIILFSISQFMLFYPGEGVDGLACVRFGMVTADTDVAELLSLVETVGKQEEDSWKFIDTMAEVVKKGIFVIPFYFLQLPNQV